jgi:hypothetical protein
MEADLSSDLRRQHPPESPAFGRLCVFDLRKLSGSVCRALTVGCAPKAKTGRQQSGSAQVSVREKKSADAGGHA